MEGDKKIHLVKYEKTCEPLDQGGLGIRSLKETNKALLAKWLWRFGSEQEALWRRVIAAKYKTNDLGWETNWPRGTYGCSLWRGISLEMKAFKNGVGYWVGCGRKVRFWLDSWCGVTLLNQAFSEIFDLALLK